MMEPELELRMLSDQVWIRLIAPECMFHGLWIPGTARREPSEIWRGEVKAVGPGARTKKGMVQPCAVKPGDRVIVYFVAGKAGTQYPDQNYRIVSEDQIQAVLEMETDRPSMLHACDHCGAKTATTFYIAVDTGLCDDCCAKHKAVLK